MTCEDLIAVVLKQGESLVIKTWEGSWKVTHYDRNTQRAYATHPVSGEESWFCISANDVLWTNRISGQHMTYAFGESV